MIHYHGTPISGEKTNAGKILDGRHACVSFYNPGDLPVVAQVCSTFILDNGAFSAWTAQKPITDWFPYYEWVTEWCRHPAFDWALIPDIIDGDEQQNDDLLAEWPFEEFGVPIWHLHESLDRLARLCNTWHCVALGSSGEYATPGSPKWVCRMAEAMENVCDDLGRPNCKLHGLRMLDPDIFTSYPFHSADSTNVARNCCMNLTYKAPSDAVQGELIAARIEKYQSSPIWTPPEFTQTELF